MSVLIELFWGAAVTGILWGHVSTVLLSSLGVSAGPQPGFIISSLGFAWGHILHNATKKMPSTHKQKRILVGWLSPVFLGGILAASPMASAHAFPIIPTLSTEALYYLLLWALCTLLGINRARVTDLLPIQRDSLVGTSILSMLAVFQPAHRMDFGKAALLFVLASSVNIALWRDRMLFKGALTYEKQHRAAGVFILLALAFALAAFTAVGGPGVLSWIWQYVKMAGHLVGTLIIYATIPFAWMAHWLITYLKRFMNQEPLDEEGFEFVLDRPLEKLEETVKGQRPPPWIYPVLTALVLLGILWLMWRFLLKKETCGQSNSAHAETRVNLLGSAAAKNWARDSAQEVASRLKHKIGRFIRTLGRNHPKTVEELYLHSLTVISRQMFPRKLNETPFEYLGDVLKHMPCEEGCKAFSYITQLFCSCHYGNRLPKPLEWEKGVEAYRFLKTLATFRTESSATV